MSYNGPSRNPRRKWWTPKNDEERKKFESFKNDVKTFLTISKRGVPIRQAYGDMADAMEGEIPYGKLGFKTFGEFLFHCDDVLEIRNDGCNGHYLFLRGQADQETEHLRRLVQGESKKTKYKGFKAYLYNTRPTPTEKLLDLLYSSALDKPKAPPSIRGKRGGRGRGGGGGDYRGGGGGGYRGGGGGGYRGGGNVRNGYNNNSRMPNNSRHSSYTPSPGLVNHVMKAFGLDEDEDDSGNSDDWDWSSSANRNEKKVIHEPWTDDESDELDMNVSKPKPQQMPSDVLDAQNDSMTKASMEMPDISPTGSSVKQTKLSNGMIDHQQQYTDWSSYLSEGKEFDAELIGVDGFGYMYIQLKIPQLKEGYEKLQLDLNDLYSRPGVQEQSRLATTEISEGGVVVACHSNKFIRGRIYENNKADNTCIVVNLEDREFITVSHQDLYQISPDLMEPMGQAIMCCVPGLEQHMMTDEIADAFEKTPLYPPNVKVMWIGECEDFLAPAFKITYGGKNLCDLLKQYGNDSLVQLTTQQQLDSRRRSQRLILDVLCEKSYFG